MLEIENYESVKTIINRDYETFSGLMLERYFRRVLIERQAYTRIGGWWDRKGEWPKTNWTKKPRFSR